MSVSELDNVRTFTIGNRIPAHVDTYLVKTIRYEPDPIEAEPVPVSPFAFWEGLAAGVLLSSIAWLTLAAVVVLR